MHLNQVYEQVRVCVCGRAVWCGWGHATNEVDVRELYKGKTGFKKESQNFEFF